MANRTMRHSILRRCRPWAAGLALCLAVGAPARAQDSFARIDDALSGQPAFSALGTGLGPAYAAMALETLCPDGGVWTMDLTGIRVAPGVRIDMGFADPRGSFIPVPAIPLHVGEDRLRFTVGRSAFARALAQAEAEYPAGHGADLLVLVGGIAGLSIGRDALARELAAFVRDCEPQRRTTTARR
jgi:hypothetical protein